MTRFVRLVVVAVLSLPTLPINAFAKAPESRASQNRADDRAEAERKKREERDAQRDAKEAKDAADIMKEAEDEIEDLALSALEHIYPDRFLQEYVNELGQSLV